MQKHLLYIPLIALSSALALTACSDEVTNTLTPDLPIGEKAPIELSVGVMGMEQPQTRGGITVIPSGDGEKYHAFEKPTSLFLLMKCEDTQTTPRSTKYTRTIGHASGSTTGHIFEGMSEQGSHSDIDFTKESNVYLRYWDDAYARESALSIYALAFPDANVYNDGSAMNWWSPDLRPTLGGGNEYKYSETATTAGKWSTSDHNTLLSWSLFTSTTNKDQYAGLNLLDICYSNNISKYSDNEADDHRLKFGTQTTKKFDKGELVFQHMTSKLTFVIKRGDGYAANETFAFATGTNIKLHGFNYRVENFDLATGELASGGSGKYLSNQDINRLWEDNTSTKVSGSDYTVRGLVFPNTNLTATDDDAKNAVTFTINDNKYVVSRQDLYKAILNKKDFENNYVYSKDNGSTVDGAYLEDGTKLKAGVHYVFTFTINKSQIKNITASVVDWEDVNAEHDPSNARIKLQLEERTGEHTEALASGSQFSLYLATDNIADDAPIDDTHEVYNWSKTYNAGITPTWDTDHWKTNLFWPDNKTFYHFRALCEKTSSSKQIVTNSLTNDATGDYLALNHCEKTSTATYKDILWGAPMRDIGDNSDDNRETLKWVYGPETNGFDCKDDNNHTVADGLPSGTQHQIYQAIGPTKDAIKLILFHMMSDVTFQIKTTTGADKVNLGTGTGTDVTTIKLEQIHTTGNLYMGNGLVRGNTADVANSNYQFTQTPAPLDGVITWPHYGAIPQSLENVVLVITTPDHNQYKVAMKDVLATTVNPVNLANPYSKVGGSGEDSNKYKIDRWYPGFHYTYTFTLKKTGITDLQVTILDWETVEAGNQDVVIQ